MDKLIAFVDLGGSATKVVYLDEMRARPLIMPPEVVPILNPGRLERTSIGGLSQVIEDHCLVGIKGSYFGVGALARRERGSVALALPKVDRAGLKVLAAIGTIALKLSSPPKRVSLGVFLPLEEYWSDREVLKARLREALADFSFAGRPFSLELSGLTILPEGAGLYFLRRAAIARETGKDLFAHQTISVLSMGHRQSQVLTFESGTQPTQNNSSSGGPGYIDVLKEMSAEIPGLSAESPVLLDAVINNSNVVHVQGRREPYFISDAAKRQAHLSFWRSLEDFLLSSLPTSLHQCVVLGGASHYIKPELKQFFSLRGMAEQVYWAADQMKFQIGEKLDLKDEMMILRFVDVFGAYRWIESRESL